MCIRDSYYGTREDWGIEKGVADLAQNEFYEANAPQACKDAVNAAREDVKSGKVKVTTCLLYTSRCV